MWAFDDVKALIEGVRVAGLQSATEQSLVVPDLLRKEFERRLQAELESYPKDYFVYVELPGLSPSRLDEEMLVLSNQIALVRTSMPLEKIERLVRPGFAVGVENLLGNATSFDQALEALRPISSVLLEQDSVYLRVTESGALPDIFFGEEPAFLPRALTFVRIVVFYGLEIGLFERREIFATGTTILGVEPSRMSQFIRSMATNSDWKKCRETSRIFCVASLSIGRMRMGASVFDVVAWSLTSIPLFGFYQCCIPVCMPSGLRQGSNGCSTPL